MAKHRKSSDTGSDHRVRNGRVARDGALVVLAALCLAGAFRLFTDASQAAGGPASLRGAGQARLQQQPGRGRHPAAGPRSARGVVPAIVSGRSVTAVGDSVMVGSTPALEQALPGIYIDAMVGRQFGTGLQVIASLKRQGMLRPVVVVGLGTNGPVTRSEISQLFAEIGPERKLVLVNTFEARPWEQEVNSMLAAAAADHPGVVLADWHTTIEHRTSLLWPDGIHPLPAGSSVYARMLKAAIGRLTSPSRVSRR